MVEKQTSKQHSNICNNDSLHNALTTQCNFNAQSWVENTFHSKEMPLNKHVQTNESLMY
jgi:hypothetical protein